MVLWQHTPLSSLRGLPQDLVPQRSWAVERGEQWGSGQAVGKRAWLTDTAVLPHWGMSGKTEQTVGVRKTMQSEENSLHKQATHLHGEDCHTCLLACYEHRGEGPLVYNLHRPVLLGRAGVCGNTKSFCATKGACVASSSADSSLLKPLTTSRSDPTTAGNLCLILHNSYHM